MKSLTKLFFVAAVALVAFASCKKDNDPIYNPQEQFRLDSIAIKNYVATNMPDATYDEGTGIWYKIIEPGETGSYTYKITDTLNAKFVLADVTVNYTGKLLSGVTFDENNTEKGLNFYLQPILNYTYPFNGGMIPAWTYAFVPKKIGDITLNGLTQNGLQKGTHIIFITPSYWAYQNMANNKVPANSPLIFDIVVKDIKPIVKKVTVN